MMLVRIAITLALWPMVATPIDWANEIDRAYLQSKRMVEQSQWDAERSRAEWDRLREQQETLMRQIQEGRWGSAATFPPEINVNVRR